MSHSTESNLERCAKRIIKGLWDDYTTDVVDACAIEQALHQRGDTWNEDHIAFRTFPGPHTGAAVVGGIFEALGFKRRDEFHFEDKQLRAWWYEPPATEGRQATETCPKVFVSELIPDRFSGPFRKVISDLTAQVTGSPLAMIQDLSRQVALGETGVEDRLVDEATRFLTSGPAWARPRLADYDVLRRESDYAAWTLIFGGRVNHFTVSTHLMKTFHGLVDLNQFILNALLIPMNTSGGLVKGSRDLALEQSSTMAVQVPVLFQEGQRTLPYAFVEFAYRYPIEGCSDDGMWHSYYQGFRTSNADKIFESTDVKRTMGTKKNRSVAFDQPASW